MTEMIDRHSNLRKAIADLGYEGWVLDEICKAAITALEPKPTDKEASGDIERLADERRDHKKTIDMAIARLGEAAHRFNHLAQQVVSPDPDVKKVFESNRDDCSRWTREIIQRTPI